MARILLVEDDPDDRSVLELILRGNGYEVDAVATAAEAQARLDSRPYALVIADGRLPDGRGVEIADKAASLDIPRLILTGYIFQADPADLDRHEHLMKPIRAAALLEAVQRRVRSERA